MLETETRRAIEELRSDMERRYRDLESQLSSYRTSHDQLFFFVITVLVVLLPLFVRLKGR